MLLLIVDTEKFNGITLDAVLTASGIAWHLIHKPENALNWAVKNRPDAILCQLNMEPLDGIALCRELRGHPLTAGVILILSDEKEDNYIRTLCLNAGADAFVKRPVDTGLLKATLLALYRRQKTGFPENVNANEPVILLEKHLVMHKGREILLPRKEFEIFALLYFNRGNVLTRNVIIRKVWKERGNQVNPRTIDVHVRRLREQVGNQFIQTIKGVGYKYKPV